MRLTLAVVALLLTACTTVSTTAGVPYAPKCVIVSGGGGHNAPDHCNECPTIPADGMCKIGSSPAWPCNPACPDGATWGNETGDAS